MGHVEWLVGELRTGFITGVLPLTDGQWTVTLDDAGTMSGTLQLSDPAVRSMNPYAAAEPARTFLAAAWIDDDGGETILEAGPIWTHAYDDAAKTLRIGAAGVWSYYDHRKIMKVLAAGETAANVTLTASDASLQGVAVRLVALAHSHTNGALPVNLPDEIPGTLTREYPGAELPWIGPALRDLTAEDGGPEITFRPRRSGTDDRYLVWDLLVGTGDRDGKPWLTQGGADWVWDSTRPGGTVAGVSVNIDGTKMGDRAWVAGSGAEESRIIVSVTGHTLTAGGWPLLEVERQASDTIKDAAWAASLARQDAVAASQPGQSWSVKLNRPAPLGPGASFPRPGQVWPGHWGQVVTGGTNPHPYLPSATWRGRVTQIDGDDIGAMDVQFQPTIGG